MDDFHLVSRQWVGGNNMLYRVHAASGTAVLHCRGTPTHSHRVHAAIGTVTSTGTGIWHRDRDRDRDRDRYMLHRHPGTVV